MCGNKKRAKEGVQRRRQSKFAQHVSSARDEKRELKDLIKKPKSCFMACK